MSAENVELVRRLVGIWEAGRDLGTMPAEELEPMFELLHPEIEVRWAPEMPDAEVMRGHEGLRKAVSDWLEPWDEFRMEPLEFIDAGDHVVVPFKQRGRGKRSGVETVMEVTQVYTVRDGRVVRCFEYSSKGEALRAAGTPSGGSGSPP